MDLKLIKVISLIAMVFTGNCAAQNEETPVYLGTYTKKEAHVNGKADGIFLAVQNKENGSLQPGRTVAKITNPSFVKVTENGENLYAVSELGQGDDTSGYIYSYKRDIDNSLEELGRISTESFAPCHIELDKTGKYVFVSNYVGGIVMVYQRGDKGNLKKLQKIQLENADSSHAHSVSMDSKNQTAYVTDLGNDKIWIFDFNSKTGKLSPNPEVSLALEKGAGPRHFTFSENSDFAYVINELNSSIAVFKIKKNGGLETLQVIQNLPDNFKGKNSAADIHLHPSGKFLYTSNRGHNSIAAFSINQKSGKLAVIDYYSTKGETPRNFAISPDGEFLYAANQDSNSITIFKIDRKTGKLNTHVLPVEIMSPVCVAFAKNLK